MITGKYIDRLGVDNQEYRPDGRGMAKRGEVKTCWY
jgi:hypothetical protein